MTEDEIVGLISSLIDEQIREYDNDRYSSDAWTVQKELVAAFKEWKSTHVS